MARRGILVSAGLHAAVIAAISIYVIAEKVRQDEQPVVFEVELVSADEQPSIAHRIQRDVPQPLRQALAEVEAPKMDIGKLDVPPEVDVEPPPEPEPEPMIAEAAAEPMPPQPEAVPEEMPASPAPPPTPTIAENGPAPLADDPSSQSLALAGLKSELAERPQTDAQAAAPNPKPAEMEEHALSYGLPDGIGVRQQGPKVSLDILGDVLFEFDSAELKPEARLLIDGVAASLARYTIAMIDVNGYTDTSGASDHNLKLSKDRASAVADQLAHDGIDANLIRAEGYGSTLLAILTPEGVREPRNRRVEIIVITGGDTAQQNAPPGAAPTGPTAESLSSVQN